MLRSLLFLSLFVLSQQAKTSTFCPDCGPKNDLSYQIE